MSPPADAGPSGPSGLQPRRDRLTHDSRRAVGRTRDGAVAGARWLVWQWRRSLQFKVVAITLLLGLLVVLLLGSFLYQRIAGGLVHDRVASAQEEAAKGAREVRSRFEAADRVDPTSLNVLAADVVQQVSSPGEDHSREAILTRAPDNTGAVIATVLSGQIGLDSVPPELRAAVAKDVDHQQVQVVEVTSPDVGGRVPAVIVGTRVQLSVAGGYDLYFIFPMQREQETLGNVSRTFAVGGLTLVLLEGLVALVVTRLVVDPVRRAAHVSERLAAGGLDERLRVRGHDDLARLATSFNAMADSLQKQIRQLEDLSRVQQRFVSDVSHELRTPLTTIRMAGDLLHDYRAGFDAVPARSAELLHDELDRFESLLGDLLEISRFDAGAAALEVEPTDLRDSVGRVVSAFSGLAERRGSTVTIQAPPGPCVADIDPRRVDRILRNLVVNAIEHGEGQPLLVEVGVNAGAVAVCVQDRGVGLRPGESGLVFNRFWRADPARARTTGGTGLGLAISLEDARLHDGWLQAWGEPGAGSRFRLTLPRRPGEPIVESPLPLAPPAVTRPRAVGAAYQSLRPDRGPAS